MARLEQILHVERPKKEKHREVDSFYLVDFTFTSRPAIKGPFNSGPGIVLLGDKTLGLVGIDYKNKKSELIHLCPSRIGRETRDNFTSVAVRKQDPRVRIYTGNVDGIILQSCLTWSQAGGHSWNHVILPSKGREFPSPIVYMDFSPDGSLFAVVGENGAARTYSVNDPDGNTFVPEQTNHLKNNLYCVNGISFSNEGLVTSHVNTLLMNKDDGSDPKELLKHFSFSDVAVRPQGDLIAFTDLFGVLSKSNLSEGNVTDVTKVATYDFPIAERIKFSPDGKYLGAMTKAGVDIYEVIE